LRRSGHFPQINAGSPRQSFDGTREPGALQRSWQTERKDWAALLHETITTGADASTDRDTAPIEASVLVPVLDEEANIRATVAAMQAQRVDGEIEFLFMDGGSRDATRAILEDLASHDSRLRILDNPGRRTPNALNIGLRHARGEFIVRMDAHTYYPPEYIAKGIERLRRGDVAWVSGAPRPHGRGTWSRRVALATTTWLGTGGASFRHGSDREIEVQNAFTGIWRRATLEAHGGWDEAWPINQDSELAARIRKAGDRILCLPELDAYYVPRDSLGALARQYFRYGYYREKTSRRHPQSMRPAHLVSPGLALTVIAAGLAPGTVRRGARAGLVAYVLALATVSARARNVADRASDAATLPAVFAVMHMSWGLGFLSGCFRWGPPLAGIFRLLKRGLASGR
jgi:succinoglycan biosynthesis protein ExoA